MWKTRRGFPFYFSLVSCFIYNLVVLPWLSPTSPWGKSLQNVGNYLPKYTLSQPGKPQSWNFIAMNLQILSNSSRHIRQFYKSRGLAHSLHHLVFVILWSVCWLMLDNRQMRTICTESNYFWYFYLYTCPTQDTIPNKRAITSLVQDLIRVEF